MTKEWQLCRHKLEEILLELAVESSVQQDQKQILQARDQLWLHQSQN